MFKIVVLLYYLICIGYTALIVSKKKENGLMKGLIIIFLPVAGFVLLPLLFKPAKLAKRTEKAVNVVEIAKNDDALHHTINPEKEMNIIPIQEALILNDNKTKRKLLIQSLKENSVENTKVLELALEDEDSETSHYAATAIMEMKRKLLNSMQELTLQLDEHPDDVALLAAYVEKVNQYLKSGFLDEGAYKQYQALLSGVLEKLLATGIGEVKHYIEKINCDLALMDYEQAADFSEKFLKAYPNEEMAYMMAMKLHYTLKNPNRLQQVIASLKGQPVRLSAQGLSMIRFWL